MEVKVLCSFTLGNQAYEQMFLNGYKVRLIINEVYSYVKYYPGNNHFLSQLDSHKTEKHNSIFTMKENQ